MACSIREDAGHGCLGSFGLEAAVAEDILHARGTSLATACSPVTDPIQLTSVAAVLSIAQKAAHCESCSSVLHNVPKISSILPTAGGTPKASGTPPASAREALIVHSDEAEQWLRYDVDCLLQETVVGKQATLKR